MRLLHWRDRAAKHRLALRDRQADFQLWDLSFASRLGLAAGFDKDAEAYHALAGLGFGFVEVGTVTPLPQRGNPRPRLFRLPGDGALINRMGFNNAGMNKIRARLDTDRQCVVGVNIGKNKDTPLEDAWTDYQKCAKTLGPVADYMVVNVSSPNTPGLRSLQTSDAMKRIVERDAIRAGNCGQAS